MNALEIRVVTFDGRGRSEIRVVKAATWEPVLTVPGVPRGPDGLGRAEAKIRALLPDAEAYDWSGDWKYEPTRREVINVKRLAKREQPAAASTPAEACDAQTFYRLTTVPRGSVKARSALDVLFGKPR